MEVLKQCQQKNMFTATMTKATDALNVLINNPKPIIEQYNLSGLPLWITGGKCEARSQILHWVMEKVTQSNENVNALYFKSHDGIVHLKTQPKPERQITLDFNQDNIDVTVNTFRQQYSNADFLLVDSAETIPLNPLIQEEFFRMYCHMTERDKPIIITADAKCRDVDFHVRLMTRFVCGTEVFYKNDCNWMCKDAAY